MNLVYKKRNQHDEMVYVLMFLYQYDNNHYLCLLLLVLIDHLIFEDFYKKILDKILFFKLYLCKNRGFFLNLALKRAVTASS